MTSENIISYSVFLICVPYLSLSLMRSKKDPTRFSQVRSNEANLTFELKLNRICVEDHPRGKHTLRATANFTSSEAVNCLVQWLQSTKVYEVLGSYCQMLALVQCSGEQTKTQKVTGNIISTILLNPLEISAFGISSPTEANSCEEFAD